MKRLARMWDDGTAVTCQSCSGIIYTDMAFYVWGRKQVTLCKKCWEKRYGSRLKSAGMKS